MSFPCTQRLSIGSIKEEASQEREAERTALLDVDVQPLAGEPAIINATLIVESQSKNVALESADSASGNSFGMPCVKAGRQKVESPSLELPCGEALFCQWDAGYSRNRQRGIHE